MGKTQSKSQDGTTNINIEEHLENNQLSHEAHEIKLWLILAINILQVLFIVQKKNYRRSGEDKGLNELMLCQVTIWKKLLCKNNKWA